MINLQAGFCLKKTRAFTMAELVLCLVIVIIAMVGVLSLIPVGLDSNKRAMNSGYATDITTQFLKFNASKIKNEDWNWIRIFPDRKPDRFGPDSLTWVKDPVFRVHNFVVRASTKFKEPEVKYKGFFLLEQLSNGNAILRAIIRAWKDHKVMADGSEKVMLHMEVSWPIEVPYDSPERHREIFSLEVFKAPSITLSTDISDESVCLGSGYHSISDFYIHGVKSGEVMFACNTIQLRSSQSTKQINKIRFRSRTDLTSYTEIDVSNLEIQNNWASFQIPDEALPLKSVMIEVNGDWTDEDDWMKSYAYCSEWDQYDPRFPGENVSMTFSPVVGSFFSTPIGSENYPIDEDGENLIVRLSDGPSWLYWNDRNQELSGNPTECGVFTWTLSASDGCSSTETQLMITVRCPEDD